jgi:hypothetical protein
MLKSGIDQEALIAQFAAASARQTAQLRQAVTEATLKALQGREMTLKNIRGVVKSVSEAASAGALQNVSPKVDAEKMLATAVAGIDDALLKAVEANQVALSRFVDQGVGLQEKQLKKALEDLEKFEDTMFGAMKKAAGGAGEQLAGPWNQVLQGLQQKGTASGAQAEAAVSQVTDRMQALLREGRANSFKAAHALAQSYTALVSGVLIGLSDALRQGAPAEPPAQAKAAARKR